MEEGAPPGSRSAGGRIWTPEGTRDFAWQVAEEVPVGILVNSEPLTVMMATPCDLEEMAMGFLLGEGMVRADQLRAALVLPTEDGVCVDIAVEEGAEVSFARRAIEGRSGCGLCGMSELTEVRRTLPHAERPPLDPRAVQRAFEGLADKQPIRDANRSVHAAGFANRKGHVLLVREDVGRHTALDKLVGALAQQRMAPDEGIAVMTSRCSFELVQKAATAGLGGLAALSAPTGLALDTARSAGLPLAARAPGGIALFD